MTFPDTNSQEAAGIGWEHLLYFIGKVERGGARSGFEGGASGDPVRPDPGGPLRTDSAEVSL